MQGLSAAEKFDIITRDIPRGEAEADFVIGADEIKAILESGRDINLYWGTATTGAPHVGYFVPIYKIGDFLKAGCHVTILFADLHGFLDNMKSTWELLHHKCVWYEGIIRQMLLRVGVPLDRLRFVRGTSYQLKEQYTLDVYKLAALSTTVQAQHAGAEVVKQSAAPRLSNLMYPLLQALDEEYLGADVQFGGVDQRKIFMYAREWLPKIGYKKRAYVMNPLIPGLGKSGKMSSSEKQSKIDLHDSPDVIRDKILKAYSVDGKPEGNGLLALLRHVLFRFLDGKPLVCGNLSFKSYDEVHAAFSSEALPSLPLKEAVAALMSEFLEPLRVFFAANKHLYDAAYPDDTLAGAPGSAEQPGISFSGVHLEGLRVESVDAHPTSAKHRVLKLHSADGKSFTAVPTDIEAKELVVGAVLLAALNCVEQDVRGVVANAQLLGSSSFDKATGRAVCFGTVEKVGPVHIGTSSAVAPPNSSLGAVGKLLKTLEVKDGLLAFKGVLADPKCHFSVNGQVKI